MGWWPWDCEPAGAQSSHLSGRNLDCIALAGTPRSRSPHFLRTHLSLKLGCIFRGKSIPDDSPVPDPGEPADRARNTDRKPHCPIRSERHGWCVPLHKSKLTPNHNRLGSGQCKAQGWVSSCSVWSIFALERLLCEPGALCRGHPSNRQEDGHITEPWPDGLREEALTSSPPERRRVSQSPSFSQFLPPDAGWPPSHPAANFPPLGLSGNLLNLSVESQNSKELLEVS